MSTTTTTDLFSLESRRQRVIEWQSPGPVAKAASGMSGIETIRAIRDGILPPPPMARLIGFRMAVAEPGRIVAAVRAVAAGESVFSGAVAAQLLGGWPRRSRGARCSPSSRRGSTRSSSCWPRASPTPRSDPVST